MNLGDKVRIIKETDPYYGRIGTVAKIKSPYVGVELLDKVNYFGSVVEEYLTWSFDIADLKVVHDQAP